MDGVVAYICKHASWPDAGKLSAGVIDSGGLAVRSKLVDSQPYSGPRWSALGR